MAFGEEQEAKEELRGNEAPVDEPLLFVVFDLSFSLHGLLEEHKRENVLFRWAFSLVVTY